MVQLISVFQIIFDILLISSVFFTPQKLLIDPSVVIGRIIIFSLFISILIIMIVRIVDNPDYLKATATWLILSFVLVMIATLVPNWIFYIFNNNSMLVGNNSSPNTLDYKDVVGFYLNSMLTSALVIVGSGELYNIMNRDKRRTRGRKIRRKP